MRLEWLGRLFSGAPQGHPLNEFHALHCCRAPGPAGHSEIAAGALLAR
ncbi:MAG: hypothetical protein WA191_09750 [Telluria sp.]|nr:hypothetical protein [Telluria sp.]